MMGKNDHVVMITGGAKGIGEGCARVFCAAGWRVVICDVDAESGKRLAAELSGNKSGSCHFEQADVRKPEELKRAIEKTVDLHGRLDCLINNAGWHPPHSPIDDFPIEEFKELLDLNLVAVFAGCKFALPHLRKTRGSIINMSSLVAVMGQEYATTYCATKGAVSALTRALAIDEARHGVRVNAVLPGNIVTHMRITGVAASKDPETLNNYIESWQWMGRSGSIEEAGKTCLFLASDNASFITGIDLILSGGAELGYGPKVPYDY
jgi:NAD(P)-dependent dehydrogenase (short-subunit alcohol dehydrogenase family)